MSMFTAKLPTSNNSLVFIYHATVFDWQKAAIRTFALKQYLRDNILNDFGKNSGNNYLLTTKIISQQSQYGVY